MSLTQFAMVEELAFLIKDNLPCKHLVLTMEETLVDFLQDDSSLDGVLELEPMNSYSRLLLHRLADIFGFFHQSIGEGDDRHLIFKRSPETLIPSILVSDLLWENDECQFPSTSQLLSRKEEAPPGPKGERLATRNSLEEREAAYFAARERIFSTDEGEVKGLVKKKPQSNPVVARRMIAHALGQRIGQPNQVVSPGSTAAYGESTYEMNVEHDECSTNSRSRKRNGLPSKTVNSRGIQGMNEINPTELLCEKEKAPSKSAAEVSTKVAISGTRRRNINVPKHNLKEEQVEAAKRMFANALQIHSTKDTGLSKSSQRKQANK